MSLTRVEQPHIETVKLDGLHPVGRRPSPRDYMAQLWGRRHFIAADSKARVSSTNRQMLLGNTWLVLKPLLDAGVYLLIFGVLLQTNRGVDNFLAYLVIGVFMFGFTSRCLTTGATSVTAGKNLVRSFSFPRVALPIATVLRETLNTVLAYATMAILIVAAPPHADVTWRWLLFPAVVCLQIMFNLGIAMIAARMVTKIRDISILIAFFTRFWLYGSAVFFSYEQFIEHPTVLQIMSLNPMFQVLDISRDLLLYAQTPETSAWLILSAWSLGALVVGFVLFWRGEETYGND